MASSSSQLPIGCPPVAGRSFGAAACLQALLSRLALPLASLLAAVHALVVSDGPCTPALTAISQARCAPVAWPASRMLGGAAKTRIALGL